MARALYAVCGFVPMAMGLPFLTNVLPLDEPKDLFSGGLMLIVNAGVGFAVAGGFGVLFLEFMEETRSRAGPGTMSTPVSLLPWIVAAWLLGIGL